MNTEYLECRILLYWIENKANQSCHGECQCGAISTIANSARNPSARKELLKTAPDYVKERFGDRYDFENSKEK